MHAAARALLRCAAARAQSDARGASSGLRARHERRYEYARRALRSMRRMLRVSGRVSVRVKVWVRLRVRTPIGGSAAVTSRRRRRLPQTAPCRAARASVTSPRAGSASSIVAKAWKRGRRLERRSGSPPTLGAPRASSSGGRDAAVAAASPARSCRVVLRLGFGRADGAVEAAQPWQLCTSTARSPPNCTRRPGHASAPLDARARRCVDARSGPAASYRARGQAGLVVTKGADEAEFGAAVGRAWRTRSSASRQPIRSVDIRYAQARLTEPLWPIWQWTRTAPSASRARDEYGSPRSDRRSVRPAGPRC